MKKILEILASAVIALILLVCGGAIVNSCTDGGLTSVLQTDNVVQEEDLTPVETIFSTPQDVVIYRDRLRKQLQTDSLLLALPDKTLTDVAYKVIKLTGDCTIGNILDEYRNNQAIYDNLPPDNSTVVKNNIPISNNSTSTDEILKIRNDGEKKLTSTEYQVKDTTIDGKQATVTTKTELYE